MTDNGKSDLFPYPGKSRSSVWRYFGFRKKGEGPPSKANLDMSQVICKMCKKSYANKGNMTNLQLHLDRNHRLEGTPKQVEQPTTSSCTSRLSKLDLERTKTLQPKIDTQLAGLIGKVSAEKKKRLDDLVLKLVVGKALPLSLVDSEFFRDLIRELEPRYKLPSRHDLKKSLEAKKKLVTSKLRSELPSIEGTIALTHEGWTSMATESYDTVTSHFITSDWELRSAVLQTTKVEGSHTGEK